MTQQTATPAWLQALEPTEPQPVSPLELALLRKQDMLDTFEKIFDPAMEALADGTSIVKFLQSDHRSLSAGRFMRWIMDDPQRYRAYLRSHEVAMELISNDLIPIADGKDDPMEDVARSKLRVDARKLMMGFNAKDRFTTTTKVDVTGHQSISLVGLMKDREQQGIAMVERLNNLLPPVDATIKADNPYDTPSTDLDDEDAP
jgi:hypothetical protein